MWSKLISDRKPDSKSTSFSPATFSRMEGLHSPVKKDSPFHFKVLVNSLKTPRRYSCLLLPSYIYFFFYWQWGSYKYQLLLFKAKLRDQHFPLPGCYSPWLFLLPKSVILFIIKVFTFLYLSEYEIQIILLNLNTHTKRDIFIRKAFQFCWAILEWGLNSLV